MGVMEDCTCSYNKGRLDNSWFTSVILLFVYTNTDDLCYDLACLIIVISSICTNGWNAIGGGLTGLIRYGLVTLAAQWGSSFAIDHSS